MINNFNLAIHRFVGKEETSYPDLDCIEVSPEYTAATDGHVLAVVSRPEKGEESGLLDVSESVTRAVDLKPKTKFPEWRGLLDGLGEPKGEIIFNADYLRQILEVITEHIDDNPTYVRLKFYGEDQSLRIDAQSYKQGFTALIMPIRPHTVSFSKCYGEKKKP